MWIGSETDEFHLEGSDLEDWVAEAKANAAKTLPQLAALEHVVCVKQGDEKEWFWNYFVNG
jgi:Tfp pilus assembly protein PilP